ncbi:MAG TPA: glycosyltransferase family 4 protein [Candidatus Bathyarchaeia archaeon]|nr:glycosyltransferase family 4 protein [Candidatus Bathyarchaeia archaeon]
MNTQTPLVQFHLAREKIAEYARTKGSLDLNLLVEGRDFDFTPGGVTRMIFPLLTEMQHLGLLETPHWVSFNQTAPKEASINGINLHHVALREGKIRGYGYVKEAIWKAFHSIRGTDGGGLLWKDEFSDYVNYNRVTAEEILKLDKKIDFDLFYIHDFQQLPIGNMLQSLKPKMFHWHIPIDESLIPAKWKELLSTYFNSYDAIIISCKKYSDDLKRLGYTGKARHIYPFIDPRRYRKPTQEERDEYARTLKIEEHDKVVLMVARLDPMKGQDKAIEAIARAMKEIHEVKLILVGNGSFSSSKQGLSLSKAEMWLKGLRSKAKNLGVVDQTVFAGHLPENLLYAAYDRANLSILPSIREGFGLVVIESWLYEKPTIVSLRAGVADLIENGINGLLFEPNDVEGFSQKITQVLSDHEFARTLGEEGFKSARKCFLEEGIKGVSEIMLGLT